MAKMKYIIVKGRWRGDTLEVVRGKCSTCSPMTYFECTHETDGGRQKTSFCQECPRRSECME